MAQLSDYPEMKMKKTKREKTIINSILEDEKTTLFQILNLPYYYFECY